MNIEILADGLTFPEAPRWHQGRLWFSDFYSHAVYALDLAGTMEKIVEVPGQPSGLGWLPNGDLLVVSMIDQKVMRWDGSTLSVHADLSPLAHYHCNDMLVLPNGHAFVGCFGFDPHSEPWCDTDLIAVTPDGQCSVAASGLGFPNGMALMDNGQTLVVAESVGNCLTAFDLAADQSLSNRRVLVADSTYMPDGICLDVQGNLLVTTMQAKRLMHYSAQGDCLAAIDCDVPLWAVATSDDGDILLCASDHSGAEDCQRERSGRILRLTL